MMYINQKWVIVVKNNFTPMPPPDFTSCLQFAQQNWHKGVSVLGVTEGLSSDFGSRCGDKKGQPVTLEITECATPEQSFIGSSQEAILKTERGESVKPAPDTYIIP